ncbi:FAD-binding oxidoreductase [Phycicoccus sp. MAQZ13P-2]|uniref:FAD-binding protein n=1 Tax=Phycicoccus mangrovi TaxID=2840470 RepID=UPI001C007A46|nr:FAD-binding oxidoreductase [Phycicoccus mangrovi]MBT9257150.1 FAD-binding oxidoreductase [Phycicoccus mangrovi]MBT9276351.1 FAD-binding oxidoreductase [Phycicoccus mangrovi]
MSLHPDGTGRPNPVRLTGWGRANSSLTDVATPASVIALTEVFRSPATSSAAFRGCGSSYGDAASSAGSTTVLMTERNRLIRFDAVEGRVIAQSGITLDELLAIVLPHGWVLPVIPGTGAVSLGGAVAADIHGKNHPAAGSIGRHVEHLTVLDGDLRPRELRPDSDPDPFWATVGGLGLTGPILDVALRLRRVGTGPACTQRHRAASLVDLMGLVDASHRGSGDVHVVAWLDPTSPDGRGLVDVTELPSPDMPPENSGYPSSHLQLPRTAPWDRVRARKPLPGPGLIGSGSIRCASELRWRAPVRSGRQLGPAEALMPMRRAEHWPRLFGARGLTQYQFAVPTGSVDAIEDGLTLLRHHGLLPALAVLKRLGPADPALLGFAIDGWTLALDLPTRWPGLEHALRDLDRVVVEAGGRVYLAKDRRLPAETFRAMYPQHGAWMRVREAMDPGHRFASDLSRRLRLTP